jgi:hypothetical protein
MLRISSIQTNSDEDENKPPSAWIDKHERKLFWAMWDFRVMHPTEQAQNMRDTLEVAKGLHIRRMTAMYVEPNTPEQQSLFTEDEVAGVLRMVRARLGLERATQFRDLSPEVQENLDWLFAAINDDSLRQLVFSKASLAKEAECQGAPREVDQMATGSGRNRRKGKHRACTEGDQAHSAAGRRR